jgi:hypothetical protein
MANRLTNKTVAHPILFPPKRGEKEPAAASGKAESFTASQGGGTGSLR